MTKRILIVEDEWMIATDIERILVGAGYQIVAKLGSIRKALQLLDMETCDAAIIDANLGGASSEPIAEILQRRGIPFLVISGYSRAQRGGILADAPFVSKPFNPEIILDQLKQFGA